MIPLVFAEIGSDTVIKKVGGNPELKRHLEDMGIVAGSTVGVVSQTAGNVILNVKDVRVAISREMAMKIMI